MGEIVEIKSGKDYKHLNKGKIPVYGTGGYMLSVDSALSYHSDAIGIGRKGTIDKPYVLYAPFWTVDTLFYSIPRQNYELDFVNYIFQQVHWKQLDESTGVPSLSKLTISNVSVKVSKFSEQQKIGSFFKQLDNIITQNGRKIDLLKQLKQAYLQQIFSQELRFAGFSDDWEEREFGEMYKKVNEKNDLSFTSEQIISVANMYFKIDSAARSNNDYMKTYNVFRVGDIAFEGNRSKHFSYGRFVENTIGDGIVSHVFDVFRPIVDYDKFYWKYAIHNEYIMGRVLMKATTSSTMMTNLVSKDFLKRSILVPYVPEQQKIGRFFQQLDDLISLHQKKLALLKKQKQAYLQKLFI